MRDCREGGRTEAGNGGYGAGQLESVGVKGGTIGGQIGYRWQSSNLVFGIEAQGNWVDFNEKWAMKTESLGNINTYGLRKTSESYSAKANAIGMIMGQVGYAADNLLVYIRGGAAVVNSRLDYDRSSVVTDTRTGKVLQQDVTLVDLEKDGCLYARRFPSNNASIHNKNVRWGGTLGVGVEYGLARNWSVGAEYNDIFVNKVDMALLRLNYRLGGSPVMGY
ncbi:MAG: outer membrane beta-barrel protein [Alphaproteobacteria bacterium]|nr:outer membrane beta-barrel protein [Alphaproteobacteria bacterium]